MSGNRISAEEALRTLINSSSLGTDKLMMASALSEILNRDLSNYVVGTEQERKDAKDWCNRSPDVIIPEEDKPSRNDHIDFIINFYSDELTNVKKADLLSIVIGQDMSEHLDGTVLEKKMAKSIFVSRQAARMREKAFGLGPREENTLKY